MLAHVIGVVMVGLLLLLLVRHGSIVALLATAAIGMWPLIVLVLLHLLLLLEHLALTQRLADLALVVLDGLFACHTVSVVHFLRAELFFTVGEHAALFVGAEAVAQPVAARAGLVAFSEDVLLLLLLLLRLIVDVKLCAGTAR